MGCVVYDMAKAPASWDFLQFLINARITLGTSFDVLFREGPNDGFRSDGLPKTSEQRRAIFDNVMVPALDLIGARQVHEAETSAEISYLQNVTVKAAHCGQAIPKWSIPADIMAECRAYLNGRSPLVITLREASYYTERNSNLEAWKTFARECGEDVIFVRDTAKADEPLNGFEACPRASRDLKFRAALMSLAKCNFFVGNGPAMLAEYLDAPWMMFHPLTPECESYRPGTPDWWASNVGVMVGQQFPWARPDQRIVWEADTLNAIRSAWESRVRKLSPIQSIPAWSEAARFEHIKSNCARVEYRLSDDHPAHGRTAILVCYGPSLKDTWHAAAKTEGDIFTVSAAHGFMLEQGVIPFAQIDCDPRPHKAAQFGEPDQDIQYWLGSCVHPDYLDRLEGYDVLLWHLHNGPESADNIWSIEPDAWLCVGGGSVGLRSISLLYTQGYRHFEIHGMDCSLENGRTYAGGHLGKVKDSTSVRCGDRWFESNLSLIDYARQFLDDLRLWHGATFRVHGNGLLAHMIENREIAA